MHGAKSAIAFAARGVLGSPRFPLGFDEDDGKISKDEADKLKRSISEKDREVRDLKNEGKERDDRIAELEKRLEDASTGDDEKKALERRLERLEKQVEEAKERADKAEKDLADSKRESTALGVAGRLGFKNPQRAIKLLDPEDLETEDDTERALEKLAREEPGMVSSKKQRPVEDPKPNKGGGDDDEDEDDDKGSKSKSGDEEPMGAARLRRHYAKAEEEAKKSDKGGGEGESE
jgi:hypothetical protein